MSTRSNTRIKRGNNITILYKHHDGYPEGVGAYLTDILKKYGFGLFKSNNYLNVLNSEDSVWSGFEEDDYYAGDSEYIYTIDLDNKTLSYVSKYGFDDEFDFDEIDNMSQNILYKEHNDEYVNSLIKSIKFHEDMIKDLKEKLAKYGKNN
ncbi:MAG: hypothetical protein J1F35_08210 [Erysipelotrichales bacterium]|nr:hypothetical protein [Erysipelotrichales bacterium]